MALKSGWNFTFSRANWQVACDASNQIPLEEAQALLSFFFGGKQVTDTVPKSQLIQWDRPAWEDGGTFAGYEKYLEYFKNSRLDSWKESAEGLLALVLILDQLPRKFYVDTKREFAFDKRARAITELLISSGNLRQISKVAPVKAYYGLIPLMHSEDKRDQVTMKAEFAKLMETATSNDASNLGWLTTTGNTTVKAHNDTVMKFSRFPGRNDVLNRTPTNAEVVALHRGEVMGSKWATRKKIGSQWTTVGAGAKTDHAGRVVAGKGSKASTKARKSAARAAPKGGKSKKTSKGKGKRPSRNRKR